MSFTFSETPVWEPYKHSFSLCIEIVKSLYIKLVNYPVYNWVLYIVQQSPAYIIYYTGKEIKTFIIQVNIVIFMFPG